MSRFSDAFICDYISVFEQSLRIFQDFLLHIELLSVLGFRNSAGNSYGGVTHAIFLFICWSLIDGRIVGIIRSFSSMLLSSTNVWPEVTRCWSLAIYRWLEHRASWHYLNSTLQCLLHLASKLTNRDIVSCFHGWKPKQCNHWSFGGMTK